MRLTERIYVFVCHFSNTKCTVCECELKGKECISRRQKQRYCLFCAFLKKIITPEQARENNIELPRKQVLKYIQRKFPDPQTQKRLIKDYELMDLIKQ